MGTLGWLEAIIGATETNTDTTMLAKRANAAGVFATRTSDGGATGAMGAWAIGGFAINNNTTAVQTAYCQYLEYRRSANTGTTHGIEIGGINLGSVANVSPYGGETGSTLSLWLSAGRQDVTGNDLSLAIGIIANPNRYTKGIMFSQGSLVPLAGIGGVATALPAQYAHVWYLPEGAGASAAGIPAALIRSDIVTSPGGTVVPSLIFAGSGAVIETANGTTAADFQNGLNTLQHTHVDGDLSVNGTLSPAHMTAGFGGYNDDAGAAAGGIPIGGVYVKLTNQNALTARLV